MTAFIGRREFITLLGGAAAAWPLAARAQQAERMRRIGILMPFRRRMRKRRRACAPFGEELRKRGWAAGVNVPVRRALGDGDNIDRIRAAAANWSN